MNIAEKSEWRGLRLSAERSVPMQAFALYLWVDDRAGRVDPGKTLVGTNVTLETVEVGTFERPLLYMPDEAAQQLMDDLWNAGVRPANVRSMSEIVEAKEAHIQDLRNVAFRLLDEAGFKERPVMVAQQGKADR